MTSVGNQKATRKPKSAPEASKSSAEQPSTRAAASDSSAQLRQSADALARLPGVQTQSERAPSDPCPRLWIDESGALNQHGVVSPEEYLRALLSQLTLFLARLKSCEVDQEGQTQLRDSHAGSLPGTQVLWERVELLAATCLALPLPDMTDEERVRCESDGALIRVMKRPRSSRPTDDALRQLLFALPRTSDGRWVERIPKPALDRITSMRDELSLRLPVEIREDDRGMYSAQELATRFAKDPDALRKRLDRWRENNPGSRDWIESAQRIRVGPTYLFRLAAVRELIDACPPARPPVRGASAASNL